MSARLGYAGHGSACAPSWWTKLTEAGVAETERRASWPCSRPAISAATRRAWAKRAARRRHLERRGRGDGGLVVTSSLLALTLAQYTPAGSPGALRGRQRRLLQGRLRHGQGALREAPAGRPRWRPTCCSTWAPRTWPRASWGRRCSTSSARTACPTTTTSAPTWRWPASGRSIRSSASRPSVPFTQRLADAIGRARGGRGLPGDVVARASCCCGSPGAARPGARVVLGLVTALASCSWAPALGATLAVHARVRATVVEAIVMPDGGEGARVPRRLRQGVV